MNNQVNTRALKSRLKLSDYEKIFKALNIPIYTKGHKYWSLYTACHNRDPYKGSPKLLFYFDTGMFQCLTQCSCSFDIISLVQKRFSLLNQPHSFQDALNFIIETAGLEIDTVKRINAPNICDWETGLSKFIRFRSTGSTLEPYDKSILDQLNHSVPQQWLDEGISIDTMAKYQIGYYERNQASTIPCFNRAGELVGIRCRHWLPNEIEIGKYRPLSLLDGTTYKFPTNETLFGINWNWGEIERTKTVMLVESEKAVMWLDSLYNEKNVALGMYGNILGTRQRNQIIKLGVNKVLYIPDNDWIGKDQQAYNKWEQNVIKLGSQFKGYANVEIIWDNLGVLGAKDNATDKGVEIWEKLLSSREKL